MVSIMIKTTVREIIDDSVGNYGNNTRIYLVRDGDVVFYVGQSIDMHTRMRDHLGMSGRSMPDRLTDLVIDNLPASEQWEVYFYTLDECEQVIGKPSIFLKNVDTYEMEMIAHYNPCLNFTLNPHRIPLPSRYIHSPEVANERVKYKRKQGE